jgi:putative transferase (TIGR04331 family)
MNKTIYQESSTYIIKYLKDIHQKDDIYWDKFMAPFLNSFFSYYKPTKNSKNNSLEKQTNTTIPYGNNDFIVSLEEEGYHYNLLRKGEIDYLNREKISISNPSKNYIEKYIFPYSNKGKIAFLSFPNKLEKIIYYAMSMLDTKTCRLDYLEKNPILEYSKIREKLLHKLLEEFGNSQEKMFELLVFSIPSIYIENFSFYYEKAKSEEKKLKDINVIFFLRHVFFNPTFLILLSLKSIREKKLITYQHGGVYGQTKENWSEKTEKILSTHFLTWGYEYKQKDIPFISLRFKRYAFPKINLSKKNKIPLIVLPLLFREEQIVSIENSFKILSSVVDKKDISIRFDPREKNQKKFFSILDSLHINYIINKDTQSLPNVASKYKTIIFITPNATGYLELINMHFYPLMIFHEKDWNIRSESLELYKEMKKNNVWIDFDNSSNINLNVITSKQKKAIKKFRKRFINTSFFPELKLNTFLLKEAIKG